MAKNGNGVKSEELKGNTVSDSKRCRRRQNVVMSDKKNYPTGETSTNPYYRLKPRQDTSSVHAACLHFILNVGQFSGHGQLSPSHRVIGSYFI